MYPPKLGNNLQPSKSNVGIILESTYHPLILHFRKAKLTEIMHVTKPPQRNPKKN